jgi:hypothetical protein
VAVEPPAAVRDAEVTPTASVPVDAGSRARPNAGRPLSAQVTRKASAVPRQKAAPSGQEKGVAGSLELNERGP